MSKLDCMPIKSLTCSVSIPFVFYASLPPYTEDAMYLENEEMPRRNSCNCDTRKCSESYHTKSIYHF